VSLEWFFKLKEYDSLSKMRISHLKALNEQENRLSTLNERRQNTLLELENLQQLGRNLEQSLFETEKKLKEAETQKQRLVDTGADESKVAGFTLKINEYETECFNLMEKQDANASEGKDLKTFLTGVEKTIYDISLEVKAEVDKLVAEVAQLEFRLSHLIEELPLDFKTQLQKTLAKKLAIGPFTRVENGACYFCHAKLSRLEESEIDMQQLLKTCKSCQRIFLPFGS
jgi:predicted  nucleic acid-binding Zn-ribbon protein